MTAPDRTLLILDLDETLVYASVKPLDREPEHRFGPYFVYCRPHVHEFLCNVAEHFDLAVWSSSSPDYANAIVRFVFPSQLELQFVWGRDRCVQRYDGEFQATYYVKDLRKVERQGYDLQRILIVDDTPQKCERNYGNAVYVPEFFGDQTDTVLQRLGAYLVTLAHLPDVRTIEKRGWRTHY
ncbi:MAG: HAD family hydrolase [Planctomycetaceae bacterium]|nr:HAD family hydrolase [Planctomycetaceae bacterium]